MKLIHILAIILLASLASSILFVEMNEAFDLGHMNGMADQILKSGHCNYKHNGELVK